MLALLKLINLVSSFMLLLLLLLLLKMGIRCQHLSQTFNLRQVQTGVNVTENNWLVSSFTEAVVVVVVVVAAAEDGYKLTEHCQQNLSQGLHLHQVQIGVNWRYWN